VCITNEIYVIIVGQAVDRQVAHKPESQKA